MCKSTHIWLCPCNSICLQDHILSCWRTKNKNYNTVKRTPAMLLHVIKKQAKQNMAVTALQTSWVFFSEALFFFFRLDSGVELLLVRLMWHRDDFFTRCRRTPGLSSNLWPSVVESECKRSEVLSHDVWIISKQPEYVHLVRGRLKCFFKCEFNYKMCSILERPIT